MLRKILSAMLVVVFMLSTVVVSAEIPRELNSLDRTIAVEKMIYGAEQTGALLDRVKKLETDIYGMETEDALLVKIDKLYDYVYGASVAEPSLLLKLNAAEWSVSHAVTSGPALQRLDNLERSIYGTNEQGGINERLAKLLNMTYTSGQLNTVTTTVNKDSLIKIEMVSELNSKSSRVGDEVVFQVAEDVYFGGVLIVAKGALGTGKVTKVERSRNFGRDAELEMSFDSITAIDGSLLPTYVGEKAKAETQSLAKAAGASVAGMVILGPIGVVGGAFIKGKDITIKPGALMYVQTREDAGVTGISAQ
ncbi:hypothetical protein P22_0578 [Propionispora sp. 2/2-37]|uniref:hypothetical protein n=1 Tax=Propionispora sp. 2/2-37 TaxID=1677858 RepID=UPI0006BB86E1|nr:hypothetical protein [Propionispora sp. 2/2-37]CUH94512.1 hypothetical protein P22_0578 [Propionispora sp. 2/2-37]